MVISVMGLAFLAGGYVIVSPRRYTATARVLLNPYDTTGRLNGASGVPAVALDRYVADQIAVAESPSVGDTAAKAVNGVTGDMVRRDSLITQEGTSDVMDFKSTDGTPSGASNMATALARAFIDNRRQAEVGLLQAGVFALQPEIQGLRATIATLNSQIGSEAGSVHPPLQAARDAAEAQLATLTDRQSQATQDAQAATGNAELIVAARTPTTPSSPRAARYIAIGGSLGLLLGLGLVFLADQVDDRVRTRKHIEDITSLPLLAELPIDPDLASDTAYIAPEHNFHGRMAETVGGLRITMESLRGEHPVKRVLITSPNHGAGKSVVAANLAVAYAQTGTSTILVSADLQSRRLEEMFGLEASNQGLANLVSDVSVVSPGQVAVRQGQPGEDGLSSDEIRLDLVDTNVPNLRVLPAGDSPLSRTADLLATTQMKSAIGGLSTLADVVIFDGPTTIEVSDAAAIASRVDCVLIVADMGRTRRDQLARCYEILTLSRATVLGVVANRSTMKGGMPGAPRLASATSSSSSGATRITPAARQGDRVDTTVPIGSGAGGFEKG